MAEIYRRFNQDGDFSDEAAQAMYLYESRGGKPPSGENGYFAGKHVMDLTVAMWKQDLVGLDGSPTLTKAELYEDFPAWWLDKIL